MGGEGEGEDIDGDGDGIEGIDRAGACATVGL